MYGPKTESFETQAEKDHYRKRLWMVKVGLRVLFSIIITAVMLIVIYTI